MTRWTDALAALPAGARVVLRCPSGWPLAHMLTACLDRSLVAVPLRPRATDPEVAQIADRVSAALVIDGERPSVRDGAGEHPAATGLAFVMFTSGSTGHPKGVMLSRAAVFGNAAKVAMLHGFGPDRPHGTCLPLYHVNALMMSLLGTRLTSAPLALCERFESAEYFERLRASSARTASIVPALLHRLVEDRPSWPDSLEYLVTAAAPLTSELAERFHGSYGPRLRQGYGLSEAVNFSFVMPMLDSAQFREQYIDRRPPVGLPLSDTEVRLDDGEVWLRSPDIMSGYWEDPAATRAAITKDGWLRTGDLGELRDGFLVLNGRRTEVINRGGEKFHPLDVERQWREAGLTGSFAAVPFADEVLGHDVGLVAEGSTARELHALHLTASLRPASVSTSGLETTSTGKPRRLAMGAALTARNENPARYAGLYGYAAGAARAIAGSPHQPTCERALRIHQQAVEFARIGGAASDTGARGAAHDALDALVATWPAIADGSATGHDMMRSCPGLWKRLMTEWPMGAYAQLMTDMLRSSAALGGRVLEVGCGVGNTTELVAPSVTGNLVWSDKVPELVARGRWPGTGVVLDFDNDPPVGLGTFDTILSTNAVHCAADEAASLRRLRSLLTTGGRLFLAEGQSPTAEGVPWCLDFLFSAFDGWWDRGGFLTRWRWLELLEQAGFSGLGYSALRSGRHDLGGVVWASR